MDLQQVGSLVIVIVTAVLMVRGAVRKRSRGAGHCCDDCPAAEKPLERRGGRTVFQVVPKS